MKIPPAQREEKRKLIVRSARIQFNRHGFNGASLDVIMAGAGLTRGGFYRYFSSKGELYSETIRSMLSELPPAAWKGVKLNAGPDMGSQIIRAYLSPVHFDDVDQACPMVTLPGEVAREESQVKDAFELVLRYMIEALQIGPDGKNLPLETALSLAVLCIGGMVVARAVGRREFADSIRDAAMAAALNIRKNSAAKAA